MMKITKTTLWFLFGMLLMLISCIEEFDVPNTTSQKFKSELVIQGRILSGEESTFYLSMTSAFGSNKSNFPIEDATITIIGENGYESEKIAYNKIQNHYSIKTPDLPQNTQYAVKVVYNGETYQSAFQPLIISPEIDDITYQEHVDGVSIHITSKGNENSASCYMWTYEEDWEIQTEYNIYDIGRWPVYNKEIYPLLNPPYNPYRYCWMHNTSKNIHIYSTDNLVENWVKEVELIHIPINDIRISYIYSILVKQWVLSKEAYAYFRSMKMYTENTGSLFAPIPAEVKGNVTCISNPNIKVWGYVLVAQTTSKRIFVHASDFQYITPTYCSCTYHRYNPILINSWWTAIQHGSVASTETGVFDSSSILFDNECVDCLTIAGATKKRPDFWPNNHE